MDCVKQVDYGCGVVWSVCDFKSYENLNNFFLDQCVSYYRGAQAFIDRYVKNVDENTNDDSLDHILTLASNYNKGGVALCYAVQELYDPIMAEYAFMNDGGLMCSLEGNDKIEPLYKYTGATKQIKLIALVLYQRNIQTNISYLEAVVRYINEYAPEDKE